MLSDLSLILESIPIASKAMSIYVEYFQQRCTWEATYASWYRVCSQADLALFWGPDQISS